MLKELSSAIHGDGSLPVLSSLLSPILRACEAFDAAGNADGTALCVCEAYFVLRSISRQVYPDPPPPDTRTPAPPRPPSKSSSFVTDVIHAVICYLGSRPVEAGV